MADQAAPAAIVVVPAAAQEITLRFDLFVTGEDNLHVTAVNALGGVRITIAGRMWDSEHRQIIPLRRDLALTSDRTMNETFIALGVGFLLNVTVRATIGAPLIGQTYVQVELVRGLQAATELVGTLTGGYVTSAQCACWPGQLFESSIAGGGAIRTITGTMPAAGAEIAETVPTGARWELLSFYAFLSSLAGTARPELRHVQGAALVWQAISPSGQGAGTVVNYNWMAGMPVVPAGGLGTGATQIAPLPTTAVFLAGEVITTSAVNNPADQWSAPRYVVREWLEVP